MQEDPAGQLFKKRKMKWISTKKKLPPDYENVIYFDSRDNKVNLGYFNLKQTPVYYVTHWMPLPQPPNPNKP